MSEVLPSVELSAAQRAIILINKTADQSITAHAKPPRVSTQLAIVNGFDKKNWVAEYKQLKKESTLEDRERFRPLLRVKNDADIREFVDEIEKLEKKSNTEIQREREVHNQFVERQKQDVDCARSLIAQSKNDAGLLDRIQQKCQSIDQSLKNFKLKSRSIYQTLADQERDLAAEISAFEDKFDAWIAEADAAKKEKPTQKLSKPKIPRSGAPRHTSMNRENENPKCAMIKEEIAKIDCDIITNGGINCGWEASDHEDFLKVRTKLGNKMTVAFITAMRRAVPTADEFQVRTHFDAYQTYLQLVDDKKDLIAKYKEAKEEEKRKKLQPPADLSKLNADLNFSKRSVSQKGVRAGSIDDKLKRREQLREWQEKKLIAENELRLEKIKVEQEQQEQARRRKEREREEKKALVEEFRYRKEMDKQRAKQVETYEKKKEKLITYEVQERIQKREEELAIKKQQILQYKENQLRERESKLIQAKTKLAEKYQVESKLFEETKAAGDKKRDKFDPKRETAKAADTFGGRLPIAPSIRQPASWRAGI